MMVMFWNPSDRDGGLIVRLLCMESRVSSGTRLSGVRREFLCLQRAREVLTQMTDTGVPVICASLIRGIRCWILAKVASK